MTCMAVIQCEQEEKKGKCMEESWKMPVIGLSLIRELINPSKSVGFCAAPLCSNLSVEDYNSLCTD